MAIRNPNNFVTEINTMLERAKPLMTSEFCIYRVPHDIRKLNEDAFTPKVVSIRPFHYEKHSGLQNMQKYKLVYVKEFLRRISSNISLDGLISFVEEVEPQVRQCYSNTIELSSEELVKEILVDSCFLFELFWRSYYDEWTRDDAFNLKPWLKSTIKLDLLLLENQLPFSYLERLFNLVLPSMKHKLPVLTFHYFANYNKMGLTPEDVNVRHFTVLVRTFHLQASGGRSQRLGKPVKHLQSATEFCLFEHWMASGREVSTAKRL